MNDPVVPWYKQFWPWLVVGLPAIAVVASLHMVYVAFTNQDALVKDEYYKAGLAINQVKANDYLAKELNLKADVLFDDLTGEIIIKLEPSQSDPSLVLSLVHPFDNELDFSLAAKLAPSGAYVAQLPKASQQRWYLQLQNQHSNEEQVWRLKGEINLAETRSLILAPQ